MHAFTVILALTASVFAAPAALEARDGCPNLPGMEPMGDLCCVYSLSPQTCCTSTNLPDSTTDVRYKYQGCNSPSFATADAFNLFYVCQIDPTRADCAGVPYTG